MKDFIVVFKDNGARIIKGIKPSDWQGVPNVLVNPDISELAGVPPHLWKLEGSSIIKANGVPDSSPIQFTEHRVRLSAQHYRVVLGIALATSFSMNLLFLIALHFIK